MRIAKRGFTLIELLIVVAIIAILAAIAIPNFLQAQIRAKVAKAKAEMQSLATALEAYEVDNNVYVQFYRADPEDINGTAPNYVDPNSVRLRPLTTPISYIASVPKPMAFPSTNADPAVVDTYDYVDEASFIIGRGSISAAQKDYGGGTWGYTWRLSCAGPMLMDFGADNIDGSFYGNNPPYSYGGPKDYPDPQAWPDYYDPTNGTVSNGEIIRFSSSIGVLEYPGGLVGPVVNN